MVSMSKRGLVYSVGSSFYFRPWFKRVSRGEHEVAPGKSETYGVTIVKNERRKSLIPCAFPDSRAFSRQNSRIGNFTVKAHTEMKMVRDAGFEPATSCV